MTSGEPHERPEPDDDRDLTATSPHDAQDPGKTPGKPPRTKGHVSDHVSTPQGDAQDS
jgi:hypothetical protein